VIRGSTRRSVQTFGLYFWTSGFVSEGRQPHPLAAFRSFRLTAPQTRQVRHQRVFFPSPS
jgi:hypothetical protein